MKTMKLSILALVAFSVFSSGCSSTSPLQLRMQSDQSIYRLNDEIKLECEVRNTSTSAVTFRPSFIREIEMTDETRTPCIPVFLQVMERSEKPVTLKPNDIHKYTVLARIINKKGGISAKHGIGELKQGKGPYREVEGLFVDFPSSSYYLRNGTGSYRVTSLFTTMDKAIFPDEHEQADPEDWWRGELRSNIVSIEIVE
jgi:hypothetical protein